MTGSNFHRRRSIRAAAYDYTQPGAYFVTICTHHREALFGQVTDGEMRLSSFGLIVQEEWLRTAELRSNVALDAFVIMPNHVHGILMILAPDGDRGRAAEPVAPTIDRQQLLKKSSLGSIVGQFKTAAARRINRERGVSGVSVWQRNYYEHIIRSDRSLERIRDYIDGNPGMWAEDRYFVEATVRV